MLGNGDSSAPGEAKERAPGQADAGDDEQPAEAVAPQLANPVRPRRAAAADDAAGAADADRAQRAGPAPHSSDVSPVGGRSRHNPLIMKSRAPGVYTDARRCRPQTNCHQPLAVGAARPGTGLLPPGVADAQSRTIWVSCLALIPLALARGPASKTLGPEATPGPDRGTAARPPKWMKYLQTTKAL